MERAARIAPACSGVMARGPQELQQGRSVEARQHDAEAPLQVYLLEHLRRREAGGEGGPCHCRWMKCCHAQRRPLAPPLWLCIHRMTGNADRYLRSQKLGRIAALVEGFSIIFPAAPPCEGRRKSARHPACA